MANRKLVIALAVLSLTGSSFVIGFGNVEWEVAWYPMIAPGEYDFDTMLAQTQLPFLISEQWELGALLDSSQLLEPSQSDGVWDRVGFRAVCEFYLEDSGEYRIAILANNGIALYVDDQIILSSWENVLPDGGGTRSIATEVDLEAGVHTLELWYYEWEGSALLHFDTNIEALDGRQDSSAPG